MKHLVIAFFISVFLVACKQSPIVYNDSLIASQVKISANLDSIFQENSSYSAIEKYRKNLVSNAEIGLENAREMADFNSNSTFRKSAIDYYAFTLNYFSSTLEIDSLLYNFKSVEGLKSLSKERYQQTKKNLEHFQNLESKLLEAQENFAKEFDLKL